MKGKILGLLAVGLLAGSMAASAAPVRVHSSVGTYDVDLLLGYTGDVEAVLEAQVWFGSTTLAGEFATLVWDQLGTEINQGVDGPYFVYQLSPREGRFDTRTLSLGNIIDLNTFYEDRYYGVAREVVVEPSTLALLGLGLAGLGLSRRRKA